MLVLSPSISLSRLLHGPGQIRASTRAKTYEDQGTLGYPSLLLEPAPTALCGGLALNLGCLRDRAGQFTSYWYPGGYSAP